MFCGSVEGGSMGTLWSNGTQRQAPQLQDQWDDDLDLAKRSSTSNDTPDME